MPIRTGYHGSMAGSVRGGLRERKKELTRSAVVDTVLRLTSEHGFDAVSVEEICDEANVSRSTFFRYFIDKQSAALQPERLLWAAFFDRLDPEAKSVTELHATLRAAMQSLDQGWEQAFATSRTVTANSPALRQTSCHYCAQIEDATARQLTAGEAPELSIQLSVTIFVATFRVALGRWQEEGEYTRAALLEQMSAAAAALPALSGRRPQL